jgi:hypothetical protein
MRCRRRLPSSSSSSSAAAAADAAAAVWSGRGPSPALLVLIFATAVVLLLLVTVVSLAITWRVVGARKGRWFGEGAGAVRLDPFLRGRRRLGLAEGGGAVCAGARRKGRAGSGATGVRGVMLAASASEL